MNRERHNVACHGNPPAQLLRAPVCSLSHTRHNQKFRRDGEFLVAGILTFSRTARSRFAALLRTLSTSSLSVCVAWGRSCLGTYSGTRIPRAKPSDTIVGRPTDLSVMPFFLTSPSGFYGRKILRQSSLMRVVAAFEWPNATSAANANGPAMRPRPSSPKSSIVAPCETSRSFPGGSRRPF